MSEDLILQSAASQNTLVYGRTLNSARQHSWIIDGTRAPAEEVTPVEVFLSAISSCCVQWVEQLAKEAGANLERIGCEISGTRVASASNRFQNIDLVVTGSGTSQSELEAFVVGFTDRCPLYATVKVATDVQIEVRIHS